jgi:hypothetical protein
MVDRGGATRWTASCAGGRILAGPVVRDDGAILVATARDTGDSRTGALECFGLDGRLQWDRPRPILPQYLTASPIGTAFISGSVIGDDRAQFGIEAIDSGGRPLWHNRLDAIVGPVAAASDIAYFCVAAPSGGALQSANMAGTIKEAIPFESGALPGYAPAVDGQPRVLVAARFGRAIRIYSPDFWQRIF